MCRGVYFLGRGVYFLGRCVYCVIFIIIVIIIIIVIVFFICSDIRSDAYSVDRPGQGHSIERCSRARLFKVRARREQIPFTIVTASTLYTLQGTTAEPGLVYYFQTPRRLSKVMKWIACYMALSRVRSLSSLRSIGLTKEIQELIDLGPPDGFLTRFLKVFEDKIANTQNTVDDVFAELGWND